MSDIFISYAREDRERVSRLVRALETAGWSVFWDRTVPAGHTWDEYIGRNLEAARCVVVVWSGASVKSRWVREEARDGLERESLVPVFFEEVRPPFGFRSIHAADLSHWDGARTSPACRRLVVDIERKLGPALARDDERPGESDEAHKRKGQGTAAGRKPSSVTVPDMVELRGGVFQMGSSEGQDEQPLHKVRVRPFAMGKYPVTNAEYRAYRPEHDSAEHFNGSTQPVVLVSWDDAVAYAAWLSRHTGQRYRLPTEAEWEYAARAGTRTNYWWGDEAGPNNANCDGCGSRWDAKQTAPVGAFAPNPFGLYDTAGNVWEWMQDCWHENYEGAPDDGSAWLEANGGDCALRVLRGGSWFDILRNVRSSNRLKSRPNNRNGYIGFRLARDLD